MTLFFKKGYEIAYPKIHYLMILHLKILSLNYFGGYYANVNPIPNLSENTLFDDFTLKITFPNIFLGYYANINPILNLP